VHLRPSVIRTISLLDLREHGEYSDSRITISTRRTKCSMPKEGSKNVLCIFSLADPKATKTRRGGKENGKYLARRHRVSRLIKTYVMYNAKRMSWGSHFLDEPRPRV
jgi:hypothetical protein